MKHSQANSIQFTLSGTTNLQMIVEDDGIGFDYDAQRNDRKYGKGLGLFNIENRVRLLNAKLDYDRTRGKGSRITLTLPL